MFYDLALWRLVSKAPQVPFRGMKVALAQRPN